MLLTKFICQILDGKILKRVFFSEKIKNKSKIIPLICVPNHLPSLDVHWYHYRCCGLWSSVTTLVLCVHYFYCCTLGTCTLPHYWITTLIWKIDKIRLLCTLPIWVKSHIFDLLRYSYWKYEKKVPKYKSKVKIKIFWHGCMK